MIDIRLTVNGVVHSAPAESRTSLADFLRDTLSLTGTHLGCEHGVCGACTVLVNGDPVRSCLMLAAQAQGAELVTVEGLASADGTPHVVQAAFHDTHAFQCGFCTPGFLITTVSLLAETADLSDEEIREALSGNLCRCTGYDSIVAGVKLAAERMQSARQVGT